MSNSITEERPATQAAPRKAGYLTPHANISETAEGYLLSAEMPGVNKEGLEITVENHTLTLVGHRSDPAPAAAHVVYRETRDLDYRRVFDLDPAIDSARITARLEHGVLTLTLPKSESVRPRKITVAD